MQFDYNSDWPELHNANNSTQSPPASTIRNPKPFPAASIDPCARLTTRVYHPSKNAVATVQNVLVKTLISPGSKERIAFDAALAAALSGGESGGDGGGAGAGAGGAARKDSFDDDSFTSTSDEDSSSDDEDMEDAGGAAGGAAASGAGGTDSSSSSTQPERAYWLQRTLREAIYGRVKYAVVLKRKRAVAGSPEAAANADWVVTNEKCAIKEMSWQHIRRERDRLAEDPIKEVYAMQYLKKNLGLYTKVPQKDDTTTNDEDDGQHINDAMEKHIMMPLDLLSDERNMYSIMPYCNGGELFDRLDERSKFKEEECRYWMNQILEGLENLQRAGVCHRDMSLENLLVHNNQICLIIDLGMCLRIPYDHDDDDDEEFFTQLAADLDQADRRNFGIDSSMDANGLGASFATMSVDGGTTTATTTNTTPTRHLDRRKRKRYLMSPQGTCGKWHYMSPEISTNEHPFDGHAVDMWAAGVILFLMLTGFPPWERPCTTDERFKYMTGGYLVQMLTEWELGISADAMDLLQRMLWLDPKDRLSLDQVRAHPWMKNGRMVLEGEDMVGVDPRLFVSAGHS